MRAGNFRPDAAVKSHRRSTFVTSVCGVPSRAALSTTRQRLAVGALGASSAAEPGGWTALASLRRSQRSRGAHGPTHSSLLALLTQECCRSPEHGARAAMAGTAAPDDTYSHHVPGLIASSALFILLMRLRKECALAFILLPGACGADAAGRSRSRAFASRGLAAHGPLLDRGLLI